jgi:hypothetical protein
MTPEKHKYLECMCESADHVIRITGNLDDNQLVIETQLKQYHNIFQRMWLAMKYIVGYESKCGHWDVTILDMNTMKELNTILLTVILNAIRKT